MTSKQRIGSADIAKGIAILCIVAGHIGIYTPDGAEVLQPWLYQFHVPVFFVIAGYFLNNKLPIGRFAIQKARRLLVPYAATAAGIVVVIAALSTIQGGSTEPTQFASIQDALLAALYGSGSWYVPTPAGIVPIGAIWFLPALFTALIIGRVTIRWKLGWLIALPLALAALASARIFWLPLSIQPGCVGSLFVIFGVFLRKRDFLERKPDWLVVFACGALFVMAGAYNLKLSLASLLTAGNVFVSLLVGAGSSVLLLCVSIWLDTHRSRVLGMLASVLEYFGKGSLSVLCVHLFMIDVGVNAFVSGILPLPGVLHSILLMLFHVAVCAASIPLFRKAPVLRSIWP